MRVWTLATQLATLATQLAACAAYAPGMPVVARSARTGPIMASGYKGYFAETDVLLVDRAEEDVAKFHAKERHRWREVYDEEYVEAPQEYYPGDRVEIVGDVQVKSRGEVVIENARGMRGTITHYEFDDGYESCQTCSTSCPVTVLLDDAE